MVITKPAGAWRYEDLFDLPEDGRRWEIIDGELYQMPSPTFDHALAISRLIAELMAVVLARGGLLLTAPLDVFFPGADPVQPDVLVLLGDRLGFVRKRGVEGPPSLVVEVLSPSNTRHDTVRKRAVYARGGVPEYWIVDPEAETIEVLALAGNVYVRRVLAAGDATVTSGVLPELAFPASVVFEGIPIE